MKFKHCSSQVLCAAWCGAILLAGLCPITILAAQVNGVQAGRWTAAASPYVVMGDIVVPSGQTLTIEPGVVVKFAGYYSLKVEGTLVAIGLESKRIVFTSVHDSEFDLANAAAKTPPSSRDWKGIEFFGAGTQRSQLEQCILR